MAKTIYEMAVDYATEDGEGGKPIVIKCEKDAAIFGANYVLEEIENVIKSDRILGHPFPSLEMRYNQIINVIEQLKK